MIRVSLYLLIIILIFARTNYAQINVNFVINTSKERAKISPYIYGANGGTYQNITARRAGGNRYTGYNWENNASHAGTDWYNSNDNHLPWIMGIPNEHSNDPAIVLTTFHDTSLVHNAYSLITLQMAGYVAKDKNGTVTEAETAPSPRWATIVNVKGSPFTLTPNVNDDYVYIDELLNFIINKYGNASSPTGIKGYALDNEPELWSYTHPRIKPTQTTCAELLSKSVSLATTIKNIDPDAEVFGPVLYGFSAYYNFQNAPDWSNYSSTYPRFVDAYLDQMRLASNNAGRRLLDVLDVHWYPEPAGVYGDYGDTSRTVAEERMQLTRSLWDSSYVENSWIGQWFSPVAIIHSLQNSIRNYYPGTKLAISEYDYGAPNHISGGIAQADALGIFGKFGVYFASKWNSIGGYIRSAYFIYRNYDGNNSTFGDIKVKATTNNIENSSIYASFTSSDSTKLHIIAINKNYDNTLVANFNIQSDKIYNQGEIWYFDKNSTDIKYKSIPANSISNNQFNYNIPPLSVYHFVLSNNSTNVEESYSDNSLKDILTEEYKVYPNPVNNLKNLRFIPSGSYEIYNIAGQRVGFVDEDKIEIVKSVCSGIYFVNKKGNNKLYKKVVVIK